MQPETEIRVGEARKLEAECLKLELEAREIERRLRAKWWEGSRFPQYVVAIAITAALLFGWWRTCLEPILRQETEVNNLAVKRNATLNALLEAKNESLAAESRRIIDERDRLKQVGDKLERESQTLKKEQQALQVGIRGLQDKNQDLIIVGVQLKKEKDRLINQTRALE